MVALVSVFAVVTSLAVFAMPLGVKEKRTVLQIESDVTTLKTDIDALSNAIDALQTTGVTIPQLIAVAANVFTVGVVLNQLGIDAANTPGPVDESSALSILQIIQEIQPVAITALGNVAAKKTALEDVLPGPVGTSVVNTAMTAALTAMSTIFSSAASALLSTAPPDLVGTASGIQAAVENSFSAAIATFSPLL